MDIVEFAEKFMGVELQEWQKTNLRVLEKLPPNTDIRIVMGRHGKVYTYLSPRAQKELLRHG
jgi:hypothetical protein